MPLGMLFIKSDPKRISTNYIGLLYSIIRRPPGGGDKHIYKPILGIINPIFIPHQLRIKLPILIYDANIFHNPIWVITRSNRNPSMCFYQ